MASFTQELIARQRNSLNRAPPPKPPQAGVKNAIQTSERDSQVTHFPFKLKKTGFRESLIADDFVLKDHDPSDKPENEVQSVIAKRKALFETQKPENQELKPKPKPKPKPVPRAPKLDKENTEKTRSKSCSSDNEVGTDDNENTLFDDSKERNTLRPLPTLQSLGKRPPKPTKPAHLKNLLEKFIKDDIVIAPRRNTLRSDADENDTVDQAKYEDEDFYDDVEEGLKNELVRNRAQEPMPAVPTENHTTSQEDTGEFYDDVGESVGKGNEMNGNEPICEETYDDVGSAAEQVANDDQFGEEFYEPLMENEDAEGSEPTAGISHSHIKNTTTTPPPSIPKRTEERQKHDSKKRDPKDKKELEIQKRKDKEEQKKMKEEQKRKEKGEKEEKKKRERDDKELRKKHKLKLGCEGSGFGVAKSDFLGDGKFELPAKEGETLTIICEEDCPQGSWLVKNTAGHLGYVPSELIRLQVDNAGNRISIAINEELYEDVDQYQSGSLGVPSTPPAVPTRPPSSPQAGEEIVDEDFYDDICGQEPIDEDLYEELPADQ